MGMPLPALMQAPQPDPLKRYAEIVSLQNLQQQQQMEKQRLGMAQQMMPLQVQAAQQENQVRQNQINDANVFMESLRSNKGDLDAALDHAANNGMSGQGYMQFGQQILARKAAVAKMTSEQLDAQSKMNDQLSGHLEEVRGAGPEGSPERAQKMQQVLQNYPALQSRIPPGMNPTDDQLQQFETGLMGMKWSAENALAKRRLGSEEMQAQARKAQAETSAAALQARLPGGPLYAPTIAAQEVPAKAQAAAAEAAARIPAEVQGEIAKASALAPTLDQVTKTTVSGKQYIDLTNLSGPQAAIVKQRALAQGVPLADKNQADAIENIDTARQNLQYMLDTVGKKLASGAPERLWYGPANTLERIAQSDPDIAAMGTYRNAAIQTMRAVAGSKGLRINRAEVQLAIDNDIPKATDTLPVAQAKLKNLNAFLDNQENSLLVSNRAAGSRPGIPGGGANRPRPGGPPPGATHIVPGRDGKNHYTNAAGTVDLGIAP